MVAAPRPHRGAVGGCVLLDKDKQRGRLPALNGELVRTALGLSAIRTQVVFSDAADVNFQGRDGNKSPQTKTFACIRRMNADDPASFIGAPLPVPLVVGFCQPGPVVVRLLCA